MGGGERGNEACLQQAPLATQRCLYLLHTSMTSPEEQQGVPSLFSKVRKIWCEGGLLGLCRLTKKTAVEERPLPTGRVTLRLDMPQS